MKKFCSSLREHATNVIHFENKKMLPLTKKELKLHQDVIACYICGKRFVKNFASDKFFWKVRDHRHFTDEYRATAPNIWNLRFSVLNEILLVFSQWVKLWLSFYHKRNSKRVWGTIWISWGKTQDSGKPFMFR